MQGITNGLTTEEVAERIKHGEVNRVEKFTTRSVSGILQNNILTVFNGVLTASVIALIIIGNYTDGLFLSAVTVLNMLAGIVGEFRAKLALDKLALLQRRTVIAVRNGQAQEVAVDAVVKDDVIVFESGDQIIADGVLLSSAPVFMDESLLTGEADTIMKKTGEELLSGSFCVRGSGQYTAVHVGRASSVNILTAQAKTYKFTRTPLEHSINVIIRILTVAMILFVLLLILASFVKNVSLAEGILSIVMVIKAFVPEGLILVSTLAFALGALRAAKRQVLVQKLNAVESMSHLTTLCLDKTGTLGTNHLTFERIEILSSTPEAIRRQLGLFVGALSNKNKTVRAIETKFQAIPSILVEELPFSPIKKVSAVRVRSKDGEVSLWLGAPEILGCNHITSAQEKILEAFRNLGLRVLLFANSPRVLSEREDISPLAFIILKDELRPDVAKAVQFYEKRGVILKVLSGDHADTVAALAKRAGISVSGEAINGTDLSCLTPADFAEAIGHGQIFGRLTPQQKKQIIEYLQISGEFVGMIGDGVNDILALKQADIGVAMNSGAAAARDVADIILLKDTFTYLPALSQEGDRTIYSVKRVSQLFFTKNIYSLFFILLTGFVGLNFPLTPRYITWIDVLTIGTPAALLALMAPTVKKQSTGNFLQETLGPAAIYGLVISFLSLAIYANFSLFQDRTKSYGDTAAVSVIIFLALYVVYQVSSIEREKSSPWGRKIVVWTILLGALGLNFVAVYWPPLRDILGLTSLDVDSWLTILGVSIFGIWLMRQFSRKGFLTKLVP